MIDDDDDDDSNHDYQGRVRSQSTHASYRSSEIQFFYLLDEYKYRTRIKILHTCIMQFSCSQATSS